MYYNIHYYWYNSLHNNNIEYQNTHAIYRVEANCVKCGWLRPLKLIKYRKSKSFVLVLSERIITYFLSYVRKGFLSIAFFIWTDMCILLRWMIKLYYSNTLLGDMDTMCRRKIYYPLQSYQITAITEAIILANILEWKRKSSGI